MFTERLEAAAERLRAAAGESRILGLLAGNAAEAGDDPIPYGAWRRTVLREGETGVIPRWFVRIRSLLFAQSLREVGVFLVAWGISAVAVLLIGRSFDVRDPRFFVPLAVLLSALPLCASVRSVAEGLADDVIPEWFLLRFCRFQRSLFDVEGKRERLSTAFFAGGAVGVLSGVVNPVWIPAAFALSLLILLGFSVPELTLIPIVLGFPFLGLLPHPSLILGGAALWSVICWIPKAINGHREVRFCRADVFLLLFAAVSTVGGMVNAAGANGLGPLLSVYLLAAWFPVRTWLTSSLWRRRTVGCLLFSGSLCAGFGILQYALGMGEARWMDLSRFGNLGGRVCSTFTNPNILAVFLLVVFGLSLGGLLAGKRICVMPLLLAVGCLIVTWSRGAWLGAIAATIFCLLLHSRKSLAALLLSPLVSVAVFPWLPGGIRTRFESIGNLTETSSHYRVNTWKSVLRMIRVYPFGIGIGEENFHTVYPKFAISGTEGVMHAHNVFLQIAAEHGVAALLVFLTLIWMIFRRFLTIRIANSSNSDGKMLGCAASLVAMLTMGMFDHLWYQPTLFWLFWFVAALLWAHTDEIAPYVRSRTDGKEKEE